MTVKAQFIKDPDATLDYLFDWVNWLEAGETITERLITSDAGVTITGSQIINTSTAVRVWVSGGTVGGVYGISCRVTTSAGRIDERTIRLEIINR